MHGMGQYLVKRYAAKVRRYLRNAEKLSVEEGGRSDDKAGEIVWGAAIITVKAYAAAHGVSLHKSPAVSKYVIDHMTEEDRTKMAIFRGLHNSFYCLEESEFEFIFAQAKTWMNDKFADCGVSLFEEE